MKTVITDGGRREAGFNEQRDCTVRALAISLKLPYAQAHAFFEELGREPGKGFSFSVAANRCDCYLFRKTRRCRVYTALEFLTSGRFVFRVRGHVFAVIDGVIHDSGRVDLLRNRIVTHIWEVTKLPTPA